MERCRKNQSPRWLMLLFQSPEDKAEEELLLVTPKGATQLQAGHWTGCPNRILSSLSYPSMLTGSVKQYIPCLWEVGNKKSFAI